MRLFGSSSDGVVGDGHPTTSRALPCSEQRPGRNDQKELAASTRVKAGADGQAPLAGQTPDSKTECDELRSQLEREQRDAALQSLRLFEETEVHAETAAQLSTTREIARALAAALHLHLFIPYWHGSSSYLKTAHAALAEARAAGLLEDRSAEAGQTFLEFARLQAEWSQATFGTDAERGPIGPLKHLAKEVQEALEHLDDHMEYVDCF